ncbi:tetratricopeptide repeat-containing sensor histidine kinase [Hymenobacter cellulosilyticus]|uniref:Tetratricopeptide repeat protein n=1 Tax=Hymenobacter cellulosilyticus TaxID=2932248 RepID=A0A8T9QCI3_9BACT|nr:tetratricopeptide repeat protein [Hymenobacter cellulosilyticus]UOQ74915.1 tetratricopeptide repeat protein [Hymenobacter cellulosilyticus]
MALLLSLLCAPRQTCRSLAQVLLLGLLSLPASAAPLPSDSLRQALRTASSDTDRVKTTLRLSAALVATDTAQASQYAHQALALSRRVGYQYGAAFSWLQLCTLAIIRHDNAAAAYYGAQAQAVADALQRRAPAAPRLRRLRASIANNRGNVADHLGQYEASTRYYLQAADLLLQLGDSRTLLTVYCNLGNSFQVLGQPAQAVRYWRQAVALGAGPPAAAELLPVYLQLASWHLAKGRTDSAGLALQAARPLARPGSLYTGEYYGTLAQYYLAGKQLPAARQAFDQAMPYLASKGALSYQAKVLLGLGQLDAQAGDLAQARSRLQRSLVLSEQLADPQQMLENLDVLTRVEEAAGQWQAALGYLQRSQRLRDTLAGTAVREQINQLETRYRTRQQAQQLQAGRQLQHAQQVALTQQRQLNTIYLVLLGVLTVGGILGLLLLRYRQRLARRVRAQEQTLLTTRAMLQGQDEERRRVARDLHDGLGGMLSAVKLYLSSIRTRGGLPAESAPLFDQSIDHLDSSIAELRRVARNLMPEALLTFGLAPALHDLCQAVQQAGAVPVQLTTHGLTPRLAPATEIELYRIVQELLTNSLRYARAGQILVQLMRHDDELHLVVEDDGQGFDASTSKPGVGLRSVQARAQYLGGNLQIQSQPGQGTSVSLELRLPAAVPAPVASHPLTPSNS